MVRALCSSLPTWVRFLACSKALEAVRFHLPLRGSSGFSPDYLFKSNHTFEACQTPTGVTYSGKIAMSIIIGSANGEWHLTTQSRGPPHGHSIQIKSIRRPCVGPLFWLLCAWAFAMIKFLVLILLTSSLTGCSFLVSFVVANTTNQPVNVSYSYTESCQYPGNPDLKLVSISNLQNDKKWLPLTDAQLSCSDDVATISFFLPSQTAAEVGGAVNYFGPSSTSQDQFPLTSIHFQGSSGQINLSGRQLEESFVKQSKTLWLYNY